MEIDNAKVQTKASQSEITPEMAVELLKMGNARFVRKSVLERDLNDQVLKTSAGQAPFAAVVGCIDSRVPAELIFDQGIGDIFNVRIAGNFVNQDILGSLEFSCKIAGSKAVVVLGHQECGAVKGACDGAVLGNLTAMLQNIQPAVKAVSDGVEDTSSENEEFVQMVVEKNVELTVQRIRKESEVLREMEENGEIMIVGAVYNISTGAVVFD